VKGKVFVAEYFFTTCQTICPKMNDQMQRVQEAFKNESLFSILSFTVNPEVDTVAQLKRYAETHRAIAGKWHFLTGNKEKLYSAARKSFFLLKKSEVENQGDVDPFDFVRTIALARILMPKSYVRLSAGREQMSEELQALCFFSGANSIFYGEKLLTANNPVPEQDNLLFQKLGLEKLSLETGLAQTQF
jgi:cytochrome oxidase Cu insertion factor (SCO1/SenC/PrrC family)